MRAQRLVLTYAYFMIFTLVNNPKAHELVRKLYNCIYPEMFFTGFTNIIYLLLGLDKLC